VNFTDRPSPSPEAVLRADLSDCALLFHPLFDDLVGLTPVALATWRALDGRRTVAEVATLVQAQFDGAPESVTEDVAAFLSDLARRGFVFTEPAQPSPTPGPLLLPKLGEGGGQGKGEGFSLALADGSRFLIRAGDELAARVVAQFAAAASLTPSPLPPPPRPSPKVGGGGQENRLLVVTEGHATPGAAGCDSVCVLRVPGTAPERQSGEGRGARRQLALARLSAFIGKEVQTRGGVLLHSALALFPSPRERGNGGEAGILLAGRSGVGKTTASNRLPLPWRALCDDATLVVRDEQGQYWVHPWPTWSRLFGEHADDRWDVQAAVPLRAIFVVDQAAQDWVTPAGAGEAAGLLLEVARQASRFLWVGATPDELGAFHARRFENLCALAQAVPVYLLDVSLHGAFWEEMVQVLM
jgi:hypothetical protein